MSFKSYTIQEVRQLKKRLTEKSSKMQSDLSEVRVKIRRIDHLIAAAKSKDQDIEIMIPHELFVIGTSQDITFGAIKWKASVLKIIKKSDMFLSCNFIYDRLLLEYPLELCDRRAAMKSISEFSNRRKNRKI